MANEEKKVNNMITPSVTVLSQNNRYNRYTLAIAVAKCAREATNEYQRQRAEAERLIERHETDRPAYQLVEPRFRDERAVRIGIDKILNGEYVIDDSALSNKYLDRIDD